MGAQRRILGDQQAGPGIVNQREINPRTGKPVGFESDPAYRQFQQLVPPDHPNYGKLPNLMAPHHILGIKDLVAFFSGSEEEQQMLRQALEQLGSAPGNQKGNYAALADGILSKAGAREGISSSDHGDIHDQLKEWQARRGIKFNRSDRSLDTINGRLIKDLPFNEKLGLLLELAGESELQLNQIQGDRLASGLKAGINPDDVVEFSNVPREQNAFQEMLQGNLTLKNGVAKLDFGNRLTGRRNTARGLALGGLGLFSWAGTAASGAETAQRSLIAAETKNPLDIVQAGVAGLSFGADFVPVIGELISTPADAANVAIDTIRDPKSLAEGAMNIRQLERREQLQRKPADAPERSNALSVGFSEGGF